MGSTMLMLLLLFLVCLVHGALCSPTQKQNLCSSIIQPSSYPCMEYTTVTDDGYILRLYRIPYSPKTGSASPRPPAFLLHGLFLGGESWVLSPIDQSPAFLLADGGFDVWLGSVRGTILSPDHVYLPTNSKEFWNWSWDELAAFDFPAMVGRVYAVTKSRVYVMGHSQGTLVSLAGLGDSKVSNMVAAVALLAPIASLTNAKSRTFLAAIHLQVDQILKFAGVPEVNVRSNKTVKVFDQICDFDVTLCTDAITSITGPNCCFNASRIPFIFEYEPNPTSTKNFEHYFQMVRKRRCGKYDYGPFGNLAHYGSLTSPACDFSGIPKELPILVVYGGKDTLADIADVSILLRQLPSSAQVLYLENYAHLDFILTINAKADVYDSVIEFFKSQKRQ